MLNSRILQQTAVLVPDNKGRVQGELDLRKAKTLQTDAIPQATGVAAALREMGGTE